MTEFSTSTTHGLFTSDTGNTFDNFVIWHRGNSSNYYSGIDDLDQDLNEESLSRSMDYARFGYASGEVVTDGDLLHEGAYFRVNSLQGVSDTITASIYVRGSGLVRLRLSDSGQKQYYSPNTRITNDRWRRLVVTGKCSGGNDVRLYVETAGNAPQALTFYIDGGQIERKSYPTTYCDGDQHGCFWSGMYHASTSTRRSDTRKGGRWVDILTDPDLYFTTVGGLGVAPIRNNIQPYADAPGSFHQNTKTLDRVVTILFHARNPKVIRRDGKTSLDRLHTLRQMLFEIIQPDKTAGGEAFLMEYQDGDYPVYFEARYDTGLEGEWDVRNQWVNSFPVRFLVVSPYMTNDSYEVASIDFRERLAINYVAQRYDGAWRTMNGGMNGVIYDFAEGKRGEIYAVGNFTRSNNSSGAIDPEIYSNFVCYWDGTQWQEMGSGANAVIHGIAVAPNGYVYVVGEFTSIGGVAANYAAYWDGAAWNAMGSGLNAVAYAVAVGPEGNVYVGGNFTTANGNNAYRFAIWNGSSWSFGGVEGGLNGIVRTIVVTKDGSLVYLGGNFTDEFGSPGNLDLNYVAVYIPSTNQFDEVGAGFDAAVLKLALSPVSGRLYAVGEFTATGAVSPDTILYVGYFNGTAWFPLGVGADGIVRNIDVADDETVVITGDFTRVGSVDTDHLALWNGATWVALDIDLEGNGYAVLFDAEGRLYVSADTLNANTAGVTNVTNIGTAEVAPKLYITGPCTFKWIENQTSKKRLYIDLEILEDEEVMIDFATGQVRSEVRGDLSWAVQVASDMRSWVLLPGVNTISALMTTDIQSTMQISYVPRFWSADSTAVRESL